MPRGFSKFAAAGFGTCLILLCVVFAFGAWNFRSPAPLGADAPNDVFSAMRAHEQLARLLGDETPHPIGSAANMRVKARLVERLTELGLAPEVQDDRHLQLQVAGVRPRAERTRANRRTTAIRQFC